METKKVEQQTLFGLKYVLTRSNCTRTKDSCPALFAGRADRAFALEELMYISEDTQVPPDWVREWK